MYLALIADVIDSKMVQERLDLQKQVEKTLQKMNELFGDYLASRFTLTLGDEFQALLKVDAPVFQIIDTLRSELTPTQLRFGIGLGEIVTAIDPLQSVGADGPAYWNARAAINFVHQKNDYGNTQIYFSSGKENQDFFVNALIASGEAIRSGWRDSQEEILLNLLKRSVYSESFSQQDLAQSLAINPSALSKRLKSSSVRVYLRGRAGALASIQSIVKGEENERIV
ncbi:SatD family protein [Streptococcus parasanguinis]|uniref:DNA-binding protein n=1 Tax=Streptococcus parasanguinis TaxID=1318 RepID=A0A428AVK3_STRPA|nr:SatD family protein [Streptococcus parasanguinis]MBS5358589.1 DNA-binding protein [Streptococcus parasanguinis]MCP8989150.1 SatD family protein [Streptococcus parasanguinis]MCP8991440.1 SatD family protein [Streptococcus parasanguinis]MCP9002143.1 SatD family protein [Streptococcus parasanguinis]MCP9008236.1 SatD family protein [Streptococcus parasanguinis]